MKKAVALAYDRTTQISPKIIASGKGELAKNIIEKANEFDIPLFKNKELVESLVDVEVGKDIPPKLYKAIAEVFVWLMKSEKKAQKGK